jgi:hypothetical protein
MRAQLNKRLRTLERKQLEDERKAIQRSHAIEQELARQMASWNSWEERPGRKLKSRKSFELY